jgi:hypothetical protein
MPEVALVNVSAVRWPDPDSACRAVREMQIKLHRWAGGDASRRFDDLFNLVYDPAFLVHAWKRVSTNVGARTAGIDGATVAEIETTIGVQAFLEHIRNSLKSGEFEPVEVRQVMIPKASGKLRKLGIPTVADRVVQASLKAVLEPIYEADFKPCSYGFRPNRRDRRDPPPVLRVQQVPLDLGGRHQSLFRRDRSHGPDGSPAGEDQGQTRVRVGKGVPEVRRHDDDRRPGTDTYRHPARRDTFPAAGQHRPDRAG